ncbi:hypothetical protein ABVT39_006105 [Epinephelus coioides]
MASRNFVNNCGCTFTECIRLLSSDDQQLDSIQPVITRMLSSFRRLHTRVVELSGLLTGGVTPTRCESLNQAVQMVRCELCTPTVVAVEILHTPPVPPLLIVLHMIHLLL